MKISMIKVVTILAVIVGFNSFVDAQVKNVKPERISVKSLLAPKLPVGIEFLTISQLEKDSVLNYSIANKDEQKLNSVDILLIVFDATGKPRGGESWEQQLDLAKDESIDFSRKMKTEVVPGNRAVLVVFKANGQAGQWKADSSKVIEAAKSFVVGKQFSLPEASFTKTK